MECPVCGQPFFGRVQDRPYVSMMALRHLQRHDLPIYECCAEATRIRHSLWALADHWERCHPDIQSVVTLMLLRSQP